ncbi:MAG: TetR/AcrR family transcriptional regulator [Thermomicrobiales bacterium]|nr:TetR/AcrR family transcriptional regulator [Thermomicrobiales bacterium]
MSDPAPRVGRPRSAQANRAILAATLQALIEDGYDGMSIEGVAARAGVGKTTIYRRWPGKEELVGAALSSLSQDVEVPDTGSARDDLCRLVREFRQHTLSSPIGPVIGRLVSATISSPGLTSIFQETLLRERRSAARTVIQRGIERGQLRNDFDVEIALDLIAGTVISRILFVGVDAIIAPDFPDQLIDTILHGLLRNEPD